MTHFYEEDKFSRINFSTHLRNTDRDALLPTHEHPSNQMTPINERSHRKERGQVKSEVQDRAVRLQKELEVKDKIIGELKNIIKISNESSATRLKTIYLQGERLEERSRHSQDCYFDELKENHDQIKILTIENNKLLGIIEKMSLCGDFNKENQLWQRGRVETGNLQTDKNQRVQNLQINRLRELISEKELFYEKKIDEFISSHRSLAEECQQLEEDKNAALDENQRLMKLVKDFEQGSRRSGLRDEGRVALPEKLTILKIKEQYGESLKQFQGTITIQIEHIFDVFRSSLEEVGRKVALLERRLCSLEQSVRERILQNLQIKFGRSQNKKSKIYIQEGDSYSQKDSRSASEQEQYPSRQLETKDYTESRICAQSGGYEKHVSEELVRPLYGEISQLKTVIATLESQLSEREDYYTFREREAQSTAELQACRQRLLGLQTARIEKEKREKHLIEESRCLKEQIGKLERTYKEESIAVLEMWGHKLQERENTIALLTGQLSSCQRKYEGSLEEIRKLQKRVGMEERLGKEVDLLKNELQASGLKLEQYRKLCLVLREESEQNVLNGQLLDDMKRQVNLFRLKHQENMGKLQTLEKENKSTITANRELKVKLEQILTSYHQTLNEKNRCLQQILGLESQKLELIHKVNCLETIVKGLEEQVKVKTQQQGKLVMERNSLEAEIVNYLTLFNTVTFTEVKPTSEEASFEQLLGKISKLQSSLLDATTSRKSKREQLAKLINEQMSGMGLSQTQF